VTRRPREIANQLKLHPESIIVLDNIEYADESTLAHVRTFARDGHSLLVARGAEVVDQQSGDEVFVLSTTRGFPKAALTLTEGSEEDALRALLLSLKAARPELEWNIYKDAFIYGSLCEWGAASRAS